MSPLLQRDRATPTAGDPMLSTGTPVVDLLPEAVRRRRALRAVRLKCVALLLAVVLALVGSLAWGMSTRSTAQSRETAAQAESDGLAAQIATYADLVTLRSDITAVRSAIAEGMRNEVLWADLIRHLLESGPNWAVLESMQIAITFESDYLERPDGDPFDPGPAIGTITWVAHVPTLEQSGELLRVFDATDGLLGATFTSVDLDEETGWRKVSGTVLVDDSRRTHRWAGTTGTTGEVAPADDTQEEAA